MSAILRYAKQAMREHSSPALMRGYLNLIRQELDKLEQKRSEIESAKTLPVHRALVAALNRSQIGNRLLEVSDCILILDRSLSARAAHAAGHWLFDAAYLTARLEGEDLRRESNIARLRRPLDPLDVKWSAPRGGPIESVPDCDQ